MLYNLNVDVALLIVFAVPFVIAAVALAIFIGRALAAPWRPSTEGALRYEMRGRPTDALNFLSAYVIPVMTRAGYRAESFGREIVFDQTRGFVPRLRSLLTDHEGPAVSSHTWESYWFEVKPAGADRTVIIGTGPLHPRVRAQLEAVLVSGAEQRSPVGWYPGPAGGERYWDGERWSGETRDPPIVVGPRARARQAADLREGS